MAKAKAGAGTAAKSGSGRMLVQTLAAHMARLTDPDAGKILPYAIEQQLLQTLGGPQDRKARHRYRDTLIGYPLIQARYSPEEAAQRYIDDVLRRRLQVAQSRHLQKAHELFELQCRRGADQSWREARLARSPSRPKGEGAPPKGFGVVEKSLGFLDKGISEKSPAERTRASAGPIWLQAGSAAAEVAEELSAWHALTSGPEHVGKFADKAAFDKVCSATIQAVETANAHWSALLCVHLSPIDWADQISINTAKKMSAFRTKVRELADGRAETVADWQAALAAHPVPGFADAKAFWDSKLGQALRNPPPGAIHVDVEEDALVDDRDQSAELLDHMTFTEMLRLARDAGVIDEFDIWFFNEIHRGARIDELAGSIKAKVKANGNAFDAHAYAAELGARIRAFARAQDGDDDDDDRD